MGTWNNKFPEHL